MKFLFKLRKYQRSKFKILNCLASSALTLVALIVLFSPVQTMRAALVTNGLVAEYRFDEGNVAWTPSTAYSLGALVRNGTRVYSCLQAGTSAGTGGPTGTATSNISDGTAKWGYTTVVNGYDSSGVAQPGLAIGCGSSYNMFWDGKGVQAINPSGMLIFKTGSTPVMSVAQTIILAADIAPGNVFMEASSIFGGHSSTVDLGSSNQGTFAVNGSADNGWYGGSQLGTIPILRKQGTLVQTWVNGSVNGNNAAIFTGTTKESFYLSRGAGKLTPVTWEVSVGGNARFGFAGGVYYAVVYNRALSDAEVAQCVTYVNGVLAARNGGVSLGDTIPVNKPLLLFQGDSITYGVGANYAQGWASLVGRSLYGAYRDVSGALPAVAASATGAGWGYINFGPPNVDPLLTAYGSPSSNVVFISLGVNDINAGGATVASVTAALQDRVNKVKAAGASKVVMATITPRSNGNETLRAAINLNIVGTGSTPITGIDAIADFGNDPMMGSFANTTGTTHTYYNGDGVHPGQLGHNILASIARAALVSIGVDTDKLSFGNLGANSAAGPASKGYNTYLGAVSNFEATGCFMPNKKLQNSPLFEVFYSAVVGHLGQVALGLHTNATTDVGMSGVGKPQVAYSLVNNGSGAYSAGGSVGGWTADDNSVVPAAGDILKFLVSGSLSRPVAYTLYAQVSQDGGHQWINIAHQSAPAGDLYPRLMGNDASMSASLVKCNGAASNIAPLWASAPAITSPIVGTLTTSTGAAIGSPSIAYAYQWKLGGTVIAGATNSTYLPVSADAGHTLSLTVTATNAFGSTSGSSSALTIPALTAMQTWLAANSLPLDGSGNGALTASPSGDGIMNLAKYALGISANTPGYQGRLNEGTVTASGSTFLGFIYTRPEPAPAGVNYIPEYSSDLTPGSWSSTPALISSTTSLSGSATITVRDTAPIGTTSRRFLRLRFSAP